MKKICNVKKHVRLLCAFSALFISCNLHAANDQPITAPPKINQLSLEDRKIYEDAIDLICEYSGIGDNMERAQVMILDLAKRNPQSAYTYAAQAELELYKKNQSQAYALALKATKLDPNISDPYVIIADIKIAQNDVYSAELAANKAIKIDPDKPSAMVMLAAIASMQGKYEDSELWFRKAINNQNNVLRKSNIYFSLGKMLLNNKKPSDVLAATEAFTKAAELSFNTSPWMLNNVAIYLTNSTDHYDQSIKYCEQALKIMNFRMAHINLGLAEYYKWGDSMQNPQKYKNAKIEPLDPMVIYKKTDVTPEYAFVNNASVKGSPSTSIFLLKTGLISDVDIIPSGLYRTALTEAAYGNHIDLVKLLLEKGANPNAEVKQIKTTALNYALTNKNLEMVKLLIARGARVNIVDATGTPLAQYALKKPISILEYLLQKGADPTIPNSGGNTLIASAIQNGDIEAVRLLVQKYHADVNTRASGMPILAFAATMSGTEGKEMLKILIKAGANPWVKYHFDVMHTLTRTDIDSKMFPSFKENAELILEARKTYPKPADFNPDVMDNI